MTAEQTTQAAIFDRGYRRYDGPRTGVSGAMKTLVWQSTRSVLGIGRSVWHKVIPFMVIMFAYAPATAFVGAAALIPDEFQDEFLPTYADYYGFMAAALFLFAGLVAPELLCTDRRTGMLGVYLAAPLDRKTYLAGKSIAVGMVLAVVTIGPPFLMLVALSLIDAGPAGFTETLLVGGRIIVSGAVLSAVVAAISMAVSATTERKAVASASIIGLFVGSAVVSEIVVFRARQSSYFHMLDLLGLPIELAHRIHGEELDMSSSLIPTAHIWLAVLAVIAVCALWIWDRYRRMLVRR